MSNQGDKNLEKIAGHIKEVLNLLNLDTKDEALQNTPMRVAKSLSFMTKGYDEDAVTILKSALFDSPRKNPITPSILSGECAYSGMVLVKDIDVYSMCEHHLLPFFGKAHVAYIPGKKITGLSKVARAVECFARRLQVQERLTEQICNALQEALEPVGVAVMIEAHHTCMQARGVQKTSSLTKTYSYSGEFLYNKILREEFLSQL